MSFVNELVPLGNYALIQPEEQPDKTASGLILAQQSIPRPTRAKVLAVGTGQKNAMNGDTISMIIQVGDTILYHPHAAQYIEVDGEKITYIHEGDVIAYRRSE